MKNFNFTGRPLARLWYKLNQRWNTGFIIAMIACAVFWAVFTLTLALIA